MLEHAFLSVQESDEVGGKPKEFADRDALDRGRAKDNMGSGDDELHRSRATGLLRCSIHQKPITNPTTRGPSKLTDCG
jgi:hypothetical protein